ncbi:hypothetical protein C2G38_2214559 [Gigaspora rosea]|uniref:Uncharacterized protein n=1 Tax=Gigaspora rosea TaxID=44941 RepID=A0A397UAW3_9GLOM|nr:hypothetical protein C2G38_2214559 [Gigaspora rosea]
MTDSKNCMNCETTGPTIFRSLKGEKWEEVENNGLTKVTWTKGGKLCHNCYMNFVANPLRRGAKRVKVEVEEVKVTTSEEIEENVETMDEEVSMIDLVRTIEAMSRLFYEREHVKKEGPIYSYDELRKVFQANKYLENFLDQLYLAARPLERGEKTMNRIKKSIIHICYLLASLNNTKINSFKFDVAYYLDSAGTSNEGIDTLANLGVSTMSRSVDRRKKKIADAHEKYVENALSKYLDKAFVLNIDDYHNIHVPRQSDSTSTSRPAHMATIVANPCSITAIPRNGMLNPKFIDSELIIKHLDERFITTLGIPYHERCQNYRGECFDDKLIEKLTLHSYNDRLVEKASDRHIQNAILFDFVGGNLKGVEDYTKALQIVYNQESMQEYLSNHVIPIVADWPGQFFIRKAIAHRLLLDNEVIPSFVTSFLPIMGPLHVSLNSRELVFKQNSLLFNDIYKGIFGKKKNLGKKPRPWRIDLILHLMRAAWLDISNIVYSKFGHTCKNIEFLYLTDLLNNLIPLVLDVYAVHHREGDWAAYEEACFRCWSDLFLRFDRRNYKRAPLMFFSDIFFWTETNHPIMNMITNHLASLSDCPVETVHSIIRRRTAKFFTADQLQKEARFMFQTREDNAFRQHFVNSMKYPYKPKQLHMLSQKCATLLLEIFTKMYKSRHLYPLIISSSDDGINTYKLPSLGYEITDRHLPRGFVTSRKPYTSVLCDFLHCDCISYTNCFDNDYLQNKIKINVEALKVSMTKNLGENEFIEEHTEDTGEDELDDTEAVAGDIGIEDNLLENAKKSFLNIK